MGTRGYVCVCVFGYACFHILYISNHVIARTYLRHLLEIEIKENKILIKDNKS